MDSTAKIYLSRAINEFLIAKTLFLLSENENKKHLLEISEKETFFSAVISHSYYSIFYAAKSILLSKGIETKSPEIHKKTFEAFKNNLIETGILDVELLEIYKKAIIRSDELLEIFRAEKRKRGFYTYHTIPQANKPPAHESIIHAKRFISNIQKMLEK